MKSFTFAIGDIHGRYDLLVNAILAITNYVTDHKIDDATIITCGDYIDRGPQSKEVLDLLMTATARFPVFKFVTLAGNHEHMFSEAVRKKLPFAMVNENGFAATLKSFGVREGTFDARDIPIQYIDWIDALPLYHEDKHRVFVHAYVCDGIPLKKHSAESLTWNYYDETDHGGYNGKFVVHGHIANPGGVRIYGKRINLDTLSWKMGRQPVAVFDNDMPGGPVEIMIVT